MKKILFSLVTLVCSMNMNAQIMKVYNGETLVREYNADEATHVVFEEQIGPITKGTVTAIINDKEVDVKWIQLWEGGPKFADRNVQHLMDYYAAVSSNFTWGDNWRTPSKDELKELMSAATSAGSTKVKCEYVLDENNGYGFKFTGKQEYYTKNSVFLPVQDGSYDGWANYWSSTEDSYTHAWHMYLRNHDGEWWGSWSTYPKYGGYFVRPVLR